MKALKKNTPVTIAPDVIELATAIAADRTRRNLAAGVYDARKSNDERGTFIETNGCCGEFALLILMRQFALIDNTTFAYVLKLLKNTTPRGARNGTDYGDVFLNNGFTIDAKTTHHFKGMLPVMANKRNAMGIKGYALITGDYRVSGEYMFRGFLTAEDMRRTFTRFYGYGNTAWWPQEELYALTDDPECGNIGSMRGRIVDSIITDPETWKFQDFTEEWCVKHGVHPDVAGDRKFGSIRQELELWGDEHIPYDFQD